MNAREQAAVLPASTFTAGIGVNTEEERRLGALAVMRALRVLYASAEDVGNCGSRPEDFFLWRFNDAAKLADSLGAMPQFARGAIMALAEFIHYSVHTGEPNLDCWLPVVGMTKKQLQQEIIATAEEYRSDSFDSESEGGRI